MPTRTSGRTGKSKPHGATKGTAPKARPTKSVSAQGERNIPAMVKAILADLKALGSAASKKQMSERFGITGPSAETAFGVGMAEIQKVAKNVKTRGKEHDPSHNHALAEALWNVTGLGQYEARMVAVYVDEPSLVTKAQMDRWAKDFDNWGIVDTACFKLFDQVDESLSLATVDRWAKNKHEFIRRGAFALLASLALHRKDIADAVLAERLSLIEAYSTDDRNFVKKGISWALRSIGSKRKGLKPSALKLAHRLAASDNATADGSARTP